MLIQLSNYDIVFKFNTIKTLETVVAQIPDTSKIILLHGCSKTDKVSDRSGIEPTSQTGLMVSMC